MASQDSRQKRMTRNSAKVGSTLPPITFSSFSTRNIASSPSRIAALLAGGIRSTVLDKSSPRTTKILSTTRNVPPSTTVVPIAATKVLPATRNVPSSTTVVPPATTKVLPTTTKVHPATTKVPLTTRKTRSTSTPTITNTTPNPSPRALPEESQTTETSQLPTEQHTDEMPTSQISGQGLDSVAKKRTRAKTSGKGLIELISTYDDRNKVEIVWHPEYWVPLNSRISTLFTNAIGVTVRSSSKVCRNGWSEVEEEHKRDLREELTTHFDLDLQHPRVLEYVDKKMGRSYTQFKFRLHKHYKSCRNDEEARATLPKADLWGDKRTEAEWHWLCNLYCNEKYVTRSHKNSENRQKNESTHRGGAKPFIQHAFSLAAKNGKKLSLIDNWENMYQDANHSWVSNAAHEKYANMRKARDELKDKLTQEAPEGTVLDSVEITVDHEIPIMVKECGRKGKRIRGVGAFPRLEDVSSSSSMSVNPNLMDIQHKYDNLFSAVDKMQEQNQTIRDENQAIRDENQMLKTMLLNLSKKRKRVSAVYSNVDDMDVNDIPENSEDVGKDYTRDVGEAFMHDANDDGQVYAEEDGENYED